MIHKILCIHLVLAWIIPIKEINDISTLRRVQFIGNKSSTDLEKIRYLRLEFDNFADSSYQFRGSYGVGVEVKYH